MGPLGDSNKMTCQSFIQSGIAHAHVQGQVHASPNVKLFMIYAPQMIIGIGPYPCLTNCPGPRSELDVANLFFVDYIQYVHTMYEKIDWRKSRGKDKRDGGNRRAHLHRPHRP